MKLVVSSEDTSSSSPRCVFSEEQVWGVKNRFMPLAEPEKGKRLSQFTLIPEQIEGTWPKLPLGASSTEMQTKNIFPSVSIGAFYRVMSDVWGGSVLVERLVSIENDWLKPEREKIIMFKEICYGEQIIKLKSPIKIEAVSSDEEFSLHYEPLDILVSAPTLDECEEDFQEELNVLYEEYAEEADEKLTESARELKSKLLNLVEADQ